MTRKPARWSSATSSSGWSPRRTLSSGERTGATFAPCAKAWVRAAVIRAMYGLVGVSLDMGDCWAAAMPVMRRMDAVRRAEGTGGWLPGNRWLVNV
jgi:hypothetical protein